MSIRKQIEKLFGIAFLDSYDVAAYFKNISTSGALDLKKTYEIIIILINKIEELEKVNEQQKAALEVKLTETTTGPDKPADIEIKLSEPLLELIEKKVDTQDQPAVSTTIPTETPTAPANPSLEAPVVTVG